MCPLPAARRAFVPQLASRREAGSLYRIDTPTGHIGLGPPERTGPPDLACRADSPIVGGPVVGRPMSPQGGEVRFPKGWWILPALSAGLVGWTLLLTALGG